MTEAVERLIALEGAVNFRDLGGYTTGRGCARIGACFSGPTVWAS